MTPRTLLAPLAPAAALLAARGPAFAQPGSGPPRVTSLEIVELRGFGVVCEESGGGPTWINWREYLSRFAPMLLR